MCYNFFLYFLGLFMTEMKEINIVYSKDNILIDENGNSITAKVLESIKECSALISHSLVNESLEDYRQHLEDLPFEQLMFHKLVLAYRFKQNFPDKKVTFSNTNNFYNLPTDSMGLAEVDNNFVLSDYAFTGFSKEIKVMFDYCSTGLWSDQGSLDWDMVAMSDATKDLIKKFQYGLDSMRIPYEDDFSEEEERESDSYMDSGLKGAIALKKELPDWKIMFYNYGSYYDLPIVEWDCSEITLDMQFETIKRNNEVKFV